MCVQFICALCWTIMLTCKGKRVVLQCDLKLRSRSAAFQTKKSHRIYGKRSNYSPLSLLSTYSAALNSISKLILNRRLRKRAKESTQENKAQRQHTPSLHRVLPHTEVWKSDIQKLSRAAAWPQPRSCVLLLHQKWLYCPHVGIG